MSFTMVEQVIESVIRDGLGNLVNNPDIIDRVFAQLTAPFLNRKYGQKEINRIKKLILTKQINIVHNLSDVAVSSPSYSIQLGMDVEDRGLAALEDFDSIEEVSIDSTILASGLVVTTINEASHKVNFSLVADLSLVKKGNLLKDINGDLFKITLVIDTAIEKAIFVTNSVAIDASDVVSVVSAINTKNYETRSVRSDEQILIGVHTKDALLTKYLYILLKFFLVSRKESLAKRCFIVSSFQGSDFTKNSQYQGDQMYNRFYTISGKVEDTWRAEEGAQIENIEVQTLVPGSEATSADLDKQSSSVAVSTRTDFKC